jgi:hypothetical protein
MVIRGRVRSRLPRKRCSSFLISNLTAMPAYRNATTFDPWRRIDGAPDGDENERFSIPNALQKGAAVSKHASGTFEVKILPQPAEDKVGDPTVGRLSIDKQFHGDLEATSKGQMLAVGTDVKGSAGYVAMERVAGTLHGHTGTFALQHSGTMTRGTPQLSVTVVPDSGTGHLVGLTGKMDIKIDNGKHSYEFAYELAETP